MADIKIGIKRTGFPVKIGEIELWFDSSIENLKKFFNIDKLAAERLEQTKKMAESIVLPDEINEETVKAMDEQTIDDAFSVNKEFIAIQYDLIFGDGTFEKVYEKYPDIMALEDVLEQVGQAVAQKVEDMEKERHEKSVVKMSDHLKKKASKK
ncbi:hypothetical protein [Trichococcus flocculiformis]|uniref:hypothetical protein n=1 Tax=Trichococcus flocculiformis TaxID=82803 RepID=UPI003DA6A1BD